MLYSKQIENDFLNVSAGCRALCAAMCADRGCAGGSSSPFTDALLHLVPPASVSPSPIPFLFLLSSFLLLPCSVCMRSPSSYCLGFWLFIRWHTAKSPCSFGFLNCDLIFLYFHSSPLLSSKLIQIFPCLSRQSFHP